MATPGTSAPGSKFEPRQTSSTDDFTPNSANSMQLPPARQKLLQDILDLYSCKPSQQAIKRFTPDAVFDDMFGYADDRYKIATQFYALPKLLSQSVNKGYEVIKNDSHLIQYKSEQHYTMSLYPKVTVMKSLISVSLDPATADSDSPTIKYLKEQNTGDDRSHSDFTHKLKEWQVSMVANLTNEPDVEMFKADRGAGGDKNINKFDHKADETKKI